MNDYYNIALDCLKKNVRAALPDGRMPLMYMALEPDGLSFSRPVPFRFGLDPAYGFTAGAEFGFATYTHAGDYVFLGNGHAARDSLGNMIVASDPGVGLTEFSGILCFPQLTGMSGLLTSGLSYFVSGYVRNGWNGSGIPGAAVTIDFAGPTYATDTNGFYTIPVNPGYFSTNIMVRVFAFIPTNHFSTEIEKDPDDSATYFFPFMSYPVQLVHGAAFTPTIIIKPVFFAGNLSYTGRTAEELDWTAGGEHEYDNVVPLGADCDCPVGAACPPAAPVCETVKDLVKVSAEQAKGVKVQILPVGPPDQDLPPAPFADVRAVRTRLGDNDAGRSYQAVLLLDSHEIGLEDNLIRISAFDPTTGYTGESFFDLSTMTHGVFDQRVDLELLPPRLDLDVIEHIKITSGWWTRLVSNDDFALLANEKDIVLAFLGFTKESFTGPVPLPVGYKYNLKAFFRYDDFGLEEEDKIEQIELGFQDKEPELYLDRAMVDSYDGLYKVDVWAVPPKSPESNLPISVNAGYNPTHETLVISGNINFMEKILYPAVRIELEANKERCVADGNEIIMFKAKFYDEKGRIVEDGWPVGWSLMTAGSSFLWKQEETKDGIAEASIIAPDLVYNQTLRVSSGIASAEITIFVDPLVGNLSSNTNVLDINVGQTATVTLQINATDGAEVFWTTSNGAISGSGFVQGGAAAATLDSESGQIGPVHITATVGNKMFTWLGEFTSSASLQVRVEHPWLISDRPSDGIASFTTMSGVPVQLPYYTQTDIELDGVPGALASVAINGFDPAAAYTFDAVIGNTIYDQSGSNHMTIIGAELDSGMAHLGAGSLRFDGTDAANIPPSTSLDFSRSFEVIMYIHPESVPGHTATIVSQGDSWGLQMRPDGTLGAYFALDDGTAQISTELRPEVGAWNNIVMQVSDQGLLMQVAKESASFTLTGNIVPDQGPIEIGLGFIGNMDDLIFNGEPGPFSIVEFVGIDAAGKIRLDENGEATIVLSTKNQFLPERALLNLSFIISASPGSESKVTVSDYSDWEIFQDMIFSFLGQDPITPYGYFYNWLGGMILGIGDAGALAKNGLRAVHLDSGEVNILEVLASSLGFFSEFFVGIGEGPDTGFSAIKAIAPVIKGSKLEGVLIDLLKMVKNGDELPFSNATDLWKFCAFLKDNMENVKHLKDVIANVDDLKYAVQIWKNGGDDVFNAIVDVIKKNPADAKTLAAGGDIIRTLGQVDSKVLAALKNSEKIGEAAEALADAYRAGVKPENVIAALNKVAQVAPDFLKYADDLIINAGYLAKWDVSGTTKLLTMIADAKIADNIRGALNQIWCSVEIIKKFEGKGIVKVVLDSNMGKRTADVLIQYKDGDNIKTIVTEVKSSGGQIKTFVLDEETKFMQWVDDCNKMGAEKTISVPSGEKEIFETTYPAEKETLKNLGVTVVEFIGIEGQD